MVLSHYLNQYLFIVNWSLGTKIQWIFESIYFTSFQCNAFFSWKRFQPFAPFQCLEVIEDTLIFYVSSAGKRYELRAEQTWSTFAYVFPLNEVFMFKIKFHWDVFLIDLLKLMFQLTKNSLEYNGLGNGFVPNRWQAICIKLCSWITQMHHYAIDEG